MRLGLLYISVAQSSFESQISFVTLRVQRSVCINLYNIKKKLSDPPSLLCQIYADPPFLGRQKVNDPPLNSSGPPPLLKNECSLKSVKLVSVPFSSLTLVLDIGHLEKRFPENVMQSSEMGQSYYDSQSLHRPISYYILVSFG